MRKVKNILSKILPQFFKIKYRQYLKKRNFNKNLKNMSIIKENDIVDGLGKVGIKENDTVFVHCSLSSLGYVENGAHGIINALQKVVTAKGNIIVPTFSIINSMEETLKNNEFHFDILKTESSVGSLPNAFLRLKGSKRSLHPTHSVSVWGNDSAYLVDGHHEAKTNFGTGTPFGKFLGMNGKILGLGVSYAPITFYHTFEDLNLNKFPHVYLKEKILATMIDENQKEIKKDFFCHSKNFAKNRIEKNESIEKYLQNIFDKSISNKIVFGDSHIWWMPSKGVIEKLDELFNNGISIYSNINELS